MSIKSTRIITRAQAIARIYEINALILEKDYSGIEAVTSEGNYSVRNILDIDVPLDNINKWTDRMLEDLMDTPFYRYSMFDNYHINEED